MTTPTTAPTKESQRLFIAVPLPDSLKRLIGAWTRDIRTSFPFRKWTDEADLHVTLQFLGDTAPVLIPELKAALASAAGSGRIQPFTLSLRDTRTFGRPGQPSVLWAGIGGELEQLHSLQRMIVEATAPLGFAAEKRPYSPHLTIARKYTGKDEFSPPELLRADHSSDLLANGPGHNSDDSTQPQAYDNVKDPLSWQVDEIVLYRTHMHQRQMYEAAARFALR